MENRNEAANHQKIALIAVGIFGTILIGALGIWLAGLFWGRQGMYVVGSVLGGVGAFVLFMLLEEVFLGWFLVGLFLVAVSLLLGQYFGLPDSVSIFVGLLIDVMVLLSGLVWGAIAEAMEKIDAK